MSLAFTSETIELFPQPIAGTVERAIAPTQPGRVKFQATYWPALFYQTDYKETLSPDELVAIVGRQGISLLVIPISYIASDCQDAITDLEDDRPEICQYVRKVGSFLTSLLDRA